MGLIKLLWSAFNYTCPKCRKSKMFVKPFDLAQPLAMHETCSNCDQHFEPEPGFYFGAMFLSYAIDGVTLLPLALILIFGFDFNVYKVLGFVIFLKIILLFWLMRFSRSLWLHIYVKFDPYLQV